MLSSTLKTKTCTHCGTKFMPARLMQSVCSPICARRKVMAQKVEDRAKVRTRREQDKTLPVLIAEADKAFAEFIRLRDQLAGHLCISSGKPLDWSGNGVDAGHYRSRGAASALRYHEDNCHAQSKHDNRYLAGNIVEYRKGQIARIGLERLEALDAMNPHHKWERDEVRAIRDEYRAKVRQMKRNGNHPADLG